MGRELQKRKNRSSRAKVKMPNRRKKALNPLGNDIIAKNWDKKQTMSQNYSRFGLVAKLGNATGGVSKKPGQAPPKNPLAYKSTDQGMLQVREVKVERDADGKIVRIIRNENPLDDPLNALDSDNEDGENPFAPMEDDGEEWGGLDGPSGEVVRQLEEEASRPAVKRVRYQSERELEFLQRLVDKHGQDVDAMVRDMKFNPMQQTRGDLTRRLKKAGLI